MRSLKFCSFFHPRKLSNFRIVSGFCLFDFLNNQFEKIFHFFVYPKISPKIFFQEISRIFFFGYFLRPEEKTAIFDQNDHGPEVFPILKKSPKNFQIHFFRKFESTKKVLSFTKIFPPLKN